VVSFLFEKPLKITFFA